MSFNNTAYRKDNDDDVDNNAIDRCAPTQTYDANFDNAANAADDDKKTNIDDNRAPQTQPYDANFDDANDVHAPKQTVVEKKFESIDIAKVKFLLFCFFDLFSSCLQNQFDLSVDSTIEYVR
jgi:hypothetical protein